MVDHGACGLLPHVLVQGPGSCPTSTINQACKVQPTSPGDLRVEGHKGGLWGTETTSILRGPERGSDLFEGTGVFILQCDRCPGAFIGSAFLTRLCSGPWLPAN